MRMIHFCAGLECSNGMANTARQFVEEDRARGDVSEVTNDLSRIGPGVDMVMIHGAWLPILWKAAKISRRAGARLVIRPAGSYDPARLAFHGWKKRLVSICEHRMLRRADVLLATCESERQWILGYEPEAKVEVTDLKRFFRLDAAASGTKRREPAAEYRLLYLGRRHPLKGVEFLQRAVAECQRESPSSSFSGSFCLRIVSDHFGEELERDWEWCDVLCLPTLSENFGRVVAEALERGKRVIVTDGAPAWAPSGGDEPWRERLFYVSGFRDGTDAERVRLLKKALYASSAVF